MSEPASEPLWRSAGGVGNEVGLLEGLATTRAIRRFRPDPVSDEDLAAILFAATRAPSGSNRQPARFLVLRDGPVASEAKALLGGAFRSSWARMSQGEYASLSPEAASGRRARTGAAMQAFVDGFESIPVVVLACFVRHRSPTPTEGASIYPACQNLLLAARARGLGGVMTMWHAEVEAELRALLGVPDEVGLAATIPLGQPEGGHGPVRRRPLGEVVYEDRWDSPARWAVDPPGTRFTSG